MSNPILTPEEVAACKARAEASLWQSPGPLRRTRNTIGDYRFTCAGTGRAFRAFGSSDANFIEHAREDVVALAASVEALRAERDDAGRQIDALKESLDYANEAMVKGDARIAALEAELATLRDARVELPADVRKYGDDYRAVWRRDRSELSGSNQVLQVWFGDLERLPMVRIAIDKGGCDSGQLVAAVRLDEESSRAIAAALLSHWTPATPQEDDSPIPRSIPSLSGGPGHWTFVDAPQSPLCAARAAASPFNSHDPKDAPIGLVYRLGKRRWRLIERMPLHPDLLTFEEVSDGARECGPLRRQMHPSELDDLFRMGRIVAGCGRCDPSDAASPAPQSPPCAPSAALDASEVSTHLANLNEALRALQAAQDEFSKATGSATASLCGEATRSVASVAATLATRIDAALKGCS